MLERTDKLFLALAGVSGLAAAGFAYMYLHIKRPEPPRYVEIAVAARDLKSNHRVTADDLTTLRVPADARQLVANSYSAADRESLIGLQVGLPVLKAMPLMHGHFQKLQSVTLADDKVMMSIPISGPASVSPLVAPGHRVDILVSIPKKQDTPNAKPTLPDPTNAADYMRVLADRLGPPPSDAVQTITVLQDVRVISVDDQLARSTTELLGLGNDDDAHDRAASITVEVSPADGSRLLDASNRFRHPVTLFVRPEADASRWSTRER
jgi:Flp pilus assembly protein CpaB